MQTLHLTRQLIERQSITPEDAGCQQMMAEYLESSGFKQRWMNFADTTNSWITHGNKETGPTLVFAGHTDVVPPGNLDDWSSPPFSPTEKDGLLFGRGAADMKSSLAAMLVACQHFTKKYPQHPGRIALLITSDEEGPFINGTVKVIEQLMAEQEPIDYAIVGEPSSTNQLGDVVKVGRRGSLTGWLRILGIQGHVAYPHLADNAIHKAALFISELTAQHWDKGNQYFPPTTLQVTQIKAGEAGNIVPGEIDVEFNFRYSTETNSESLKSQVLTLLDKLGLEYKAEWKLNGEPFLTKGGALVEATQQAIKHVCGLTPAMETSGGTSDGRFIAKTGAQIVEIGPVNKSIHKINENVAIDSLGDLTRIYYELMERLLLPKTDKS